MSGEPLLDDFQIAHTSTPVQIARALTGAIVRGELIPGMRVRESSLAASLGVSRNSVREAMRLMEQRGLIRHEANRGTIVSTLTLDEVSDLYRVRELLELDGVRAVRAATDLSGVAEALSRLDAALHAVEIDLHRVVEADLAFHAALVALLGSPSLDRFFGDVCAKLRFYLAALSAQDRETDRPDDLVEQHAAVLRALADGEQARARRLLGEHIRSNHDSVAAVMRARAAAAQDDRG